jgi:hypothetical protein
MARIRRAVVEKPRPSARPAGAPISCLAHTPQYSTPQIIGVRLACDNSCPEGQQTVGRRWRGSAGRHSGFVRFPERGAMNSRVPMPAGTATKCLTAFVTCTTEHSRAFSPFVIPERAPRVADRRHLGLFTDDSQTTIHRDPLPSISFGKMVSTGITATGRTLTGAMASCGTWPVTSGSRSARYKVRHWLVTRSKKGSEKHRPTFLNWKCSCKIPCEIWG